jgi:SWIM/SEC-C metal-binding protein
MPKYPFKTRIARVPQEPFREFTHKRQKRLGTEFNPAIINVHTDSRRDELLAICQENEWYCQVSVNPDEPVNELALETLKNYPKTTRFAPKPDRNEPCSCGSGKKYKKCCGLG